MLFFLIFYFIFIISIGNSIFFNIFYLKNLSGLNSPDLRFMIIKTEYFKKLKYLQFVKTQSMRSER